MTDSTRTPEQLSLVSELILRRRWDEAHRILFASPADTVIPDELALARGVYFAARRHLPQALESIAAIEVISPYFREAIKLRARVLLLLKRYSEAWSVVNENMLLFRTDAAFQGRLGYRLLKFGEYRNAKTAFRRALYAQPSDVRWLIGLARSFDGMRSWRRAAKWRLVVLQIGKLNYSDRVALVNALVKTGKLDIAKEHIAKLRAEHRSSLQLDLLEAEIAFRTKEKSASAKLDELIARLPANLELYVWRGIIEYRNEEFEKAAHFFRVASEIGSIAECPALTVKEATHVLAWQGNWYFEAKDWLKALECWKTCLDLRQRAGLRTAQPAYYDYRMAECCWYLGRLNEAAELVIAARSNNPAASKPLHYLILVKHYAAIGNVDQAKAFLTTAIQYFPTDTELLVSLAEIMVDLGDPEAAEEIWLQACRLNSDIEKTNPLKGRLELSLGRNIRNADFFQARHIIPPAFRIPDDLDRLTDKPSLRIGLKNSARAVYALVLRRSLTQYGNTALGYIWALLQPMLLFGVLLTVFYVVGRRLPPGVTVEVFLLAGIIPFRIFFHIHRTVSGALQSNRALFYFQNITPLVTYIATAVIEFLTYTTAFYILFFGFHYFHREVKVDSHLFVLICFFCLALFGMSLGMITAVLAQHFPFIEAMTTALKRGLFFVSGVFFYANEIPKPIRDILLVNPIFHLLEFIRGALFVSYTPHYADATYVAAWLLGMVLIALISDRVGRRRITI